MGGLSDGTTEGQHGQAPVLQLLELHLLALGARRRVRWVLWIFLRGFGVWGLRVFGLGIKGLGFRTVQGLRGCYLCGAEALQMKC